MMNNKMIFRSEYVDKIMAYVDAPLVKILSGVRRSGKSTILQMVASRLRERGVPDSRILFYNFDSLMYAEIKTAEKFYGEIKEKIAQNEKTYLFFDEIQEVENWEQALNSFMIDFDVDIYATGSNSRMLSSEIATYLTGRYVSFHVFPLSFKEYLMFRAQREKKELSNYEEFARYIRYGGFPAIHLQDYSLDETYAIVRDIYNSTIFSDIVRRGEIRKIDQFERIVRFAFENVGKTFSAASLSKYLKNENRVSDNETILCYLHKLESAFILHRCSRYDLQGKEILKTQEKFFICDPAMRYSVIGYASESVAAMLENIVYLELLRRGYEVFLGKLSEGEIDFVATKQENRLYVQIARQILFEETEQREYGRLLAIKDNYPKYLLRADEFSGGVYKGIKTMHIADFLLSDEY